MLVKFSLTTIRRVFEFVAFAFLENAFNLCIVTHATVPHSNLQVEVLKICFPRDERGGENYDFLYQNSIRKYEDDFEHWFIYILFDLEFF